MDGWMGGQADGWTGGWLDGWMVGRVDGWTGGLVGKQCHCVALSCKLRLARFSVRLKFQDRAECDKIEIY